MDIEDLKCCGNCHFRDQQSIDRVDECSSVEEWCQKYDGLVIYSHERCDVGWRYDGIPATQRKREGV